MADEKKPKRNLLPLYVVLYYLVLCGLVVGTAVLGLPGFDVFVFTLF